MTWWFWSSLGLILLVLELVIPTGFFLLMFGVAALIVSVVAGFHLVEGLQAQLFIFSVLAIALAFLLAKRLRERSKAAADSTPGAVGATVVAQDAIMVDAIGKGELWGAPWRLKNIGLEVINAGDECIVSGVEGVTLQVKKK